MRGVKAAQRGTMTALILIVDDDPIQRRLLEAMARRFGYDAECVESGEAALMRLQASDRPPINLLILDLVMPDLDGMGVGGWGGQGGGRCTA
jgi:CheY-like chemotaxis protein